MENSAVAPICFRFTFSRLLVDVRGKSFQPLELHLHPCLASRQWGHGRICIKEGQSSILRNLSYCSCWLSKRFFSCKAYHWLYIWLPAPILIKSSRYIFEVSHLWEKRAGRSILPGNQGNQATPSRPDMFLRSFIYERGSLFCQATKATSTRQPRQPVLGNQATA